MARLNVEITVDYDNDRERAKVEAALPVIEKTLVALKGLLQEIGADVEMEFDQRRSFIPKKDAPRLVKRG